jgi:hypothetical protein
MIKQHKLLANVCENKQQKYNKLLVKICERENNHRNIIKLLRKGANDVAGALIVACRFYNEKNVKCLIKHGVVDINKTILKVCGHYECVKTLVAHGATNFDEMLMEACHWSNSDETIEFIAKLCKKETVKNVVMMLCKEQQEDSVYNGTIGTLFRHGATNQNDALIEMCKYKCSDENIVYMINCGATNLNEALISAQLNTTSLTYVV